MKRWENREKATKWRKTCRERSKESLGLNIAEWGNSQISSSSENPQVQLPWNEKIFRY